MSSIRPVGFSGPMYIPLSEINAYCQLNGIQNSEDVDDLLRLLKVMDRHYMRHWYEEKAKKDKEVQEKPRPRG